MGREVQQQVKLDGVLLELSLCCTTLTWRERRFFPSPDAGFSFRAPILTGTQIAAPRLVPTNADNTRAVVRAGISMHWLWVGSMVWHSSIPQRRHALGEPRRVASITFKRGLVSGLCSRVEL